MAGYDRYDLFSSYYFFLKEIVHFRGFCTLIFCSRDKLNFTVTVVTDDIKCSLSIHCIFRGRNHYRNGRNQKGLNNLLSTN